MEEVQGALEGRQKFGDALNDDQCISYSVSWSRWAEAPIGTQDDEFVSSLIVRSYGSSYVI